MTHPRDWRASGDAALLFLALWRYVGAMARSRLAAPVDMPATLAPALSNALAIDEGTAAVAAVCDVLQAHWSEQTNFKARRLRAALALDAMRAIDDSMLAIHPRSAVPALRSTALPSWLDDARERRTAGGIYARDAQLSLIARGPFARSPRMELEEATFVLGDQFAALKVIDLSLFSEDGRPLDVRIQVVDHSVDRGVPHRRDRAASEVVSFAPLAESGGDLVPELTVDSGTTFIDVRKGPCFDPANRFLAAVADCAESDIFVAPELTVDRADVAHIAAGLSGSAGVRPRLLLSGSGLVPGVATEGDLPYNQATMLNGHGATLWEHRKVSAYGMLEETSEGLDIGAQQVAQLMERIAWSDIVTVADIDALGRCLVLICQDLMMGVVLKLLEEFRPDWVLVPILDSGTSLARWPARRARDLATLSEARFVVVSSLAMKDWSKTAYPGEEMGVAVGPTYVNRGDARKERPAVEAQVAPESATRRHGTLRWRSVQGWRPYR